MICFTGNLEAAVGLAVPFVRQVRKDVGTCTCPLCLWNINSPVEVRTWEVSVQGSTSYLSWGKGASPSPLCELPQSVEKVGTAKLNGLLFSTHSGRGGGRKVSVKLRVTGLDFLSQGGETVPWELYSQSLFREMQPFPALETWFTYTRSSSEARGAEGSW